MTLEDFIVRNMKIAGRTVIECSTDRHCEQITNQLLYFKQTITKPLVVVDLFTGSGNLLYHVS